MGSGAGTGYEAVPTGDRRLDKRETAIWYTVAGVTYVGASIFEKGLLNWFVGPLWLVAVVWAGPPLADRLLRRPR